MDFSFREDRILSVHQFVQQHSERISIKLRILSFGMLFELSVEEVRNVSPFLKNFADCIVHRHDLAYLWNSVLNIHVFDMQHIEGNNR